MNFSRYIKLGVGIGFLACFILFNNANISEATPMVYGNKAITNLQQGEVTAAESWEDEGVIGPISVATSTTVTKNVNRETKSKVILSKRDAKLAKLAEKAKAKAEKERLKKEEKERKLKEKNKSRQSKDNKKGKNSNIEQRINSILESLNKTEEVINNYGAYGILGEPIVTKEQALRYLLLRNPNPKITVSPEEIVDYYYEEAMAEGVRPDAAFAQALKETGNFNYGGTVTPDQNNYCGLGTTSATVKGAYFPSARIGVRAHIQHLLAYATVRPPRKNIVDPRYTLVRAAYATTTIDTWPGLNGRWAVPGNNYGQEIMEIVNTMAKI